MSEFIVKTWEHVEGTYKVQADTEAEARRMLDKQPFPWTRIEQLNYMAFDSEVRSVESASCEDCGGTGEHIINSDWPSGTEPYSEKCSTCGGGS